MLVRPTVRNEAGTVASETARLTVRADPRTPIFHVHPADASVPTGEPARFSAAAI